MTRHRRVPAERDARLSRNPWLFYCEHSLESPQAGGLSSRDSRMRRMPSNHLAAGGRLAVLFCTLRPFKYGCDEIDGRRRRNVRAAGRSLATACGPTHV